MKGAARLLKRTTMAVAECQDISDPKDDARVYYEDGCLKKDLVPFMELQGFTHHDCVMQNEKIAEVNCYFARDDAALKEAKKLISE